MLFCARRKAKFTISCQNLKDLDSTFTPGDKFYAQFIKVWDERVWKCSQVSETYCTTKLLWTSFARQWTHRISWAESTLKLGWNDNAFTIFATIRVFWPNFAKISLFISNVAFFLTKIVQKFSFSQFFSEYHQTSSVFGENFCKIIKHSANISSCFAHLLTHILRKLFRKTKNVRWNCSKSLHFRENLPKSHNLIKILNKNGHFVSLVAHRGRGSWLAGA